MYLLKINCSFQNDAGNYEYRYLFVEIHDLLQSTIVIEDNRTKNNVPTTPELLM